MRDHPDYTAAYLHAGNVLIALGERGEARAVFERGIEACRRRGDGHAMSELEGALSSFARVRRLAYEGGVRGLSGRAGDCAYGSRAQSEPS